MEAFIPGFFKGTEDAFFMAKYFDTKRVEPDAEKFIQFGNFIQKNQSCLQKKLIVNDFQIRKLELSDLDKAAEIYTIVFKNYPFPVYDPNYLRKTMKSHIRYFGAWRNGKLTGVSSSEMDMENLNAEMTDFAVLPEGRGKSVALHLLREMDKQMKKAGIRTTFTIARLNSISMNKTFLNAGYHFSGTLVNNTCISDGIESMNVYYKTL